MVLQRIQIATRIILVLGVLIFFGSIFNGHVPFTGIKHIEYVFDHPHGSIGVMRPPVRYRVERDGDYTSARILEDPIYFDIRTSIPYKRMVVVIRYRNESTLPFRIAVRSTQHGWSFVSHEFVSREDGEWMIGMADIDLSLAVRHNGKYTFALSVPGLVLETGNGASVLVQSLSIDLYREPLLGIRD